MKTQFHCFDIVQIRSRNGAKASIREHVESHGQEPLYLVRMIDGVELRAKESELEATGQSEAPLRYGEVVEIKPIDLEIESDVINLIGKRGVVSSIEIDDDGRWYFTIAIQSGERWDFQTDELKGTGIILSDEEMYGERDFKFLGRVRVDPKTGEGDIVAGDPTKLNRGPAPLKVDLDSLG